MKKIIQLLIVALATGCASQSEFDLSHRKVAPWSEEPVTLGPGVYRIQLPDQQTAVLRVESCGAIWMDTVSEDRKTQVNTLIYGPEPRMGITAYTSKTNMLANCVMVSDGTTSHFYLEGDTNTFIVLNDGLTPSSEVKNYTFVTNMNGNLILKQLPNKTQEGIGEELAEPSE